MRQIGDLLVWVSLVLVLALVAYFTPKLAQYMSSETRRPHQSWTYRDLAWNQEDFADAAE
jgi:hypothetical protein